MTNEKAVTIKVQDNDSNPFDNDSNPFEVTIVIKAELWMDNEDVALNFIDITKEFTEYLDFKGYTLLGRKTE